MLDIRNLSKSYLGKKALDDVSMQVAVGEIVVLLGPSGSGKSTLLKLIAGLEAGDSGVISWKDKELSSVAVHERGFGFMFQDYALFPHRNVFGNVAFGLEMAKQDEKAIARRVNEVLKLVGLKELAEREISNLSGGEQQRVALARALAPKPKLLMLDEPLGSLDRALRERLQIDLAQILRKSGQTSIYVTHDQEEAYSITDRIVLLNEGRVEQIGTPEDLYRKPATVFAARFLGLENLYEAEVSKMGKVWHIESDLGEIKVRKKIPVGKATMLLRPEGFRLDGKWPAKLEGQVQAIKFKGRYTEIEMDIKGKKLIIEQGSGNQPLFVEEKIQISFDPAESLQVFPHE
jgi:ABC-type Fe3+/spermidine/putrescine transport system ATPase subunit